MNRRLKKGCGILTIDPSNFDITNNTLLRGKASEIQMTEEEILANRRMLSPEAHKGLQKAVIGGVIGRMKGKEKKMYSNDYLSQAGVGNLMYEKHQADLINAHYLSTLKPKPYNVGITPTIWASDPYQTNFLQKSNMPPPYSQFIR